VWIAARCRAERPRRHWPVARRTECTWLDTPQGGVALLIGTTLAARLLFAAALGFGIDESYYFDHPPVAWWLAWGA
jgi:hypothetical protein